MRKNIILMAGIIFMFVFSLQLAEPAAAAAKLKVVDKGSTTLQDQNNNTYTYSWTTYQRGTSYVAMLGYIYSPKKNKGVYMYMYLQKVSKKKIKMHGKMIAKNYNTGDSYSQNLGTTYDYTKLTAAKYYWNLFRPEMISEMSNMVSGISGDDA